MNRFGVVIILAFLSAVSLHAQLTPQQGQSMSGEIKAAVDAIIARYVVVPSPVPLRYATVTDRETRVKGATPPLGAAGYRFVDPAFGSRMVRATDAGSHQGVSLRTPSSVHSNAWSADGRAFYATTTWGNLIPFSFDPATLTIARIGTGEIKLYGEPSFSYTEPGVLYGASLTGHKLLRYDLATHTSTTVIDLQTIAGFDLATPRTYVGGVYVSADSKRIITFFGGGAQGHHFLIAVVDIIDPTKYWLLDTLTSTLRTPDGVTQPTPAPIASRLHAISIDRAGRFVKTTASSVITPNWSPLWDVDAGTLTTISGNTGGHDAYGYGWRVNNASCCSGETYDAAQWQLRSLLDPTNPRALIAPLMKPKVVAMAEHPSWHNAQPDRLVPFISGLYRLPTETAPWRAWDDEIVAVQADAPAGTGATVWRFCHHRSNVQSDVTPTNAAFWYMPRPQISKDGRWALFTSNWGKTLGTDPVTAASEDYRQDVFLVELK
jgi:hypothetical protein